MKQKLSPGRTEAQCLCGRLGLVHSSADVHWAFASFVLRKMSGVNWFSETTLVRRKWVVLDFRAIIKISWK